MPRRAGYSLVVLLLLALSAVAQPPVVPPPVDGPVRPLPPIDLGPPGYVAPPQPFPTDGCDPGPEGWSIFGPGSAPCAWLVNWDLVVLKPHVDYGLRVNDGVPSIMGNYTNLVTVPLDWTVSPKLEVGFRLPDSGGAFLVGYRYLSTEGTGTVGDLAVRSRMTLNQVDLVYQTERIRPFGNWFVHGRIGGRIVGNFYDTRNIDGNFTQSASNYFYGGGLLGSFDIEREFEWVPGLALYGNMESGIIIGRVNQKFRSTLQTPMGEFGELVEQRGSQALQSYQFQLGLSYVPPAWNTVRIRAAYQYETWIDVGQLQQSNLDWNAHGAVLRLEWVF